MTAGWRVWRDQQRRCRHVRAFVRYCRRRGDRVVTRRHADGERVDVWVRPGGDDG